MPFDLHTASVPVFLRYLDRLEGLVEAAAAFSVEPACGGRDMFAARLAPDMLPFATQVVVAANFSLRACFPLAGREIPPNGDFPPTAEGLIRHIGRVRELLGMLAPADFSGAEQRTLRSQAGAAMVELPAAEFLAHYALPNFFFHLTTAYAILRAQGVPVDKADFDGFHTYPAASHAAG